MNINIKSTNIELTGAIKDYVTKKVNSIEKFLNAENSNIQIEVAKSTNHHHKGDIFFTEINIDSMGQKFFVRANKEDLYKSIDEAREMIVREIKRSKNKRRDVFKKGALKIKNMVRGFWRK